ncbi:hypothetical protein [Azonexus sp.]|uniref:hypothetical protein n=1 Tax=Azonexus sp. TaxID=1872668 RepID=UPI00283AABE6|nr:hypothetical protein [Azonexus sp.]
MKIEVKTSPMGAMVPMAEQGEDASFCGSDFCKPLIFKNRRQRRFQKLIMASDRAVQVLAFFPSLVPHRGDGWPKAGRGQAAHPCQSRDIRVSRLSFPLVSQERRGSDFCNSLILWIGVNADAKNRSRAGRFLRWRVSGLFGFAESRCAGPAFGCPAALSLCSAQATALRLLDGGRK